MLTRLQVSGFKNLIDVDARFGPFTCIAGVNGVGKSNLLDAILFLSALADRPLLEAAMSVRDQGAKTGDIRGLFHHVGDSFDEEMTFDAEMVIPEHGTDDLGQPAHASATFVRYSIGLRYRQDPGALALGALELVREDLKHITLREAGSHLAFPHSAAWRNKVIKNNRRTPNYISTSGSGNDREINVHQDGGSSGKPQKLLAANLPRTVLSAANSAESPTATLVRREMQSWRLLQLEPAALREPDNFTAPPALASNGAHLPATLFHMQHPRNGQSSDGIDVCAEVANRLSTLIDDVRSVHVERDERRQLLTLFSQGRDGTRYPARALSDGTLRFLALSVLALQPDSRALVCMEEPENGIHPERIPAMIRLLRDMTTNVAAGPEEDEGDGLRQVIINTHSPAVVMQVPEESLLLAEPVELNTPHASFRALKLRCIEGAWRDTAGGMEPVSKGRLLAYLNPVQRIESTDPTHTRAAGSRRLIDRDDLQQLKIPFSQES